MEQSESTLKRGDKVLVVSSTVRPFCRLCQKEDQGKDPHKEIGFLTQSGIEIDFKYHEFETPVMMTKDGHGLAYLGHLFGRLGMELDDIIFRDPNNFTTDMPTGPYNAIISIGSQLSNSVTARIMNNILPGIHPNQLAFEFTELDASKSTMWDKIICHSSERTITIPERKDPANDYGAIVYFKDRLTHFFVLSGLGPLGVRSACNYFAEHYVKSILPRFRNSPYYLITKVSRNLEYGDQPTEVAEAKLNHALYDSTKRFSVALSFPGEHRPRVNGIANELAEKLTKGRVFFDDFHKADSGRLDYDTYLQDIFQNHSELIVLFLCTAYNDDEWCGLQLRVIRELIKNRKNDIIMLFRIGDGDVDGILDIDNAIDANNLSSAEVSNLILKRLDLLHRK